MSRWDSGQFNLFMAPVNAALQPYELERIRKLRASGAEIVGIEALAPSLPRFPAPVTAGRHLAAGPRPEEAVRCSARRRR